jgi:uncharacterized surface protein with fasciclin (FAS1) repeats
VKTRKMMFKRTPAKERVFMRNLSLILAVAVTCVALVGCKSYEKAESKGAAMESSGKAAGEMPMDIVDTAVADGRFTTLVAAVKAAGLVETLKGETPYTVFAPTDEAFAKLPPGTVEGLLEDTPALRNILLYHVVPGKVMSSEVVKLGRADTALGKGVMIKVAENKVMVNDAEVVIPDIEASNGVVHVIDTVLLPSDS